MEAEKERAEWEKHEKRMRKLRKGGHDTSHYQATFEGESRYSRTPEFHLNKALYRNLNIHQTTVLFNAAEFKATSTLKNGENPLLTHALYIM